MALKVTHNRVDNYYIHLEAGRVRQMLQRYLYDLNLGAHLPDSARINLQVVNGGLQVTWEVQTTGVTEKL